VTDDPHVCAVRSAPDGVGDARFLRSGDEVVDEHAVAPPRPRRVGAQRLVEQVDALEVLHDDALGPQVVAPHLLHELGVVAPSTRMRLARATRAR
jgi:hypothetical protein